MKTVAAIVWLIASIACAGLPGPQFRVELKKAEDSAVMTSTHNSTVVSITSKSGIGGARLVRIGDVWPTRLTIRLHLKGLESLRMENGVIHFNTFLKSPRQVPYWKAGKNDGRPGAPDGTLEVNLQKTEEFIEIVVPGELTAENPTEIGLGWIDFFRN
ncbi:MAG: hypothetical protein WCN95_07660 [bacterium]